MYLKHCRTISTSCEIHLDCGTYLETLPEFLLLFIDDSQTKIDLVGLVKVRLHLHDLRESFFGVLQRPVTVIQNSDAIPKTRLLQISQLIRTIKCDGSQLLTFGF